MALLMLTTASGALEAKTKLRKRYNAKRRHLMMPAFFMALLSPV
ncbi:MULTISPECIES: hypothetical protein [Shewanella]|nr:hypothetical protein [Shewanella sp. SE1]